MPASCFYCRAASISIISDSTKLRNKTKIVFICLFSKFLLCFSFKLYYASLFKAQSCLEAFGSAKEIGNVGRFVPRSKKAKPKIPQQTVKLKRAAPLKNTEIFANGSSFASNSQTSSLNKWETALSTWQDFQATGYIPSITTVEKLMESCNTARKWDECLQIALGWLKLSKVRSDKFYEEARKTCTSTKQMEVLQLFVDDMLRAKHPANLQLYNQLMKTFSLEGWLNSTQALMAAMQSHGVQPNQQSFASMMHVLSQAGQAEEALKLFRMLQKKIPFSMLTIEVYNAAALSCARGKLFDALEEIRELAGSCGVQLRQPTLFHAIRALALARNPDKALMYMELMKADNHSLTPSVYNFVIDAHAKYGNMSVAETLYNEMLSENMFPSQYTFISLIQASLEVKQVHKALGYFKQCTAFEGLVPTALLYKKGLAIHAQLGDPIGANLVRQRMESKGFTLDMGCFTCLMLANSLAGNNTALMEAFEEMKMHGFAPSENSYGIAIHGCVQAGQVELCEKLYLEMKSLGKEIDELILSNMVRLHSIEKNFKKAEAYLEELRSRGTDPKGMSLFMASNKLLFNYIEAGELERARLLIFSLKKQHGLIVTDATLIQLVKAFADNNEPGQAEIFYRALQREDFPLSSKVMNHIIGGYAMVGDFLNAERLLDEMKGEGFLPDSLTSIRMIGGSILQKNFDRVDYYLELMKRDHLDGSLAYRKVIYGCINLGDLDRAQQYMERMVTDSYVPDIAILRSYLQACINLAPGWERGYDVLISLRKNGIPLTAKIYNLLIARCISSGHMQLAENVLSEMRHEGIEADIFTVNILLRAYLQPPNTQLVEALKVFKLARQAGLIFDAKSYTSLICYVVDAGEYEYAQLLYDDMRVSRIIPESIAVGNLMKALAQRKSWVASINYFEEALNAGVPSNLIMLNAVIQACIEAHQLQKAQYFLELIKNVGLAPDIISYSLYIRGLVMGERWAETLQLLKEMQTNQVHKDLQFFNMLLDALCTMKPNNSC